MLRTGSLRERVTIQSVTLVKDAYHEQQETWTDVCTVHASVTPVNSFEGVAADRLETEQRMLIKIRYRDGVTVKNRLKHVQGGATRYYDINSVTNVGFRDKVLEIQAVYRQDNQV